MDDETRHDDLLPEDPADLFSDGAPETAPEKEDRRILRTRRLLNQAILALLVEEPWDAISVSDIAARADINRATFYHHYQTKDELLAAALKEQFDTLVAGFDQLPLDDGVVYDYAADVIAFRHLAEHAALYRVLLGEQGLGNINFRITQYIAEFCERIIVELDRANAQEIQRTVPIPVVAQHMAGSLLGIARWWLLNDMPMSPEEVAQITHKLSMFGVLADVTVPGLDDPAPDGSATA